MTESHWQRLRRILRRSERAEVGDEIAFHIQMRTRELTEQGIDPERARTMAEERFGPVQPIERELMASTHRRRQRTDRAEMLSNIAQDVRYAIRSLRKSPAFAATSIATLALGVGATLAVFTVVNGVLLRPLPYSEPSRIQMIWIANPDATSSLQDLPLASGFYNDIERESRTFESMAAFRSWPYALSDASGADPEQVSAARVSPALFDVLGVRPMLGHPFTKEDAVPGGPNVAVIGHDLWKRRFGGDSSIVGQRVQLSGQPFTVTGVMPEGFAFPRGAELPAAFQFGLRTEVWTPLAFDSSEVRGYSNMNLSAVGRLPAGGSSGAALQELNGIMHRFLAANVPNMKFDYRLLSLADQASAKVKRGLLILFGAVVLVLLIAGSNVASLLVARISVRQRELALRAALGAGRGRIARQLVTENLVLASAGTAIGVAISYWASKVMLALVPGALPRADDVGLDWRVIGVAALVALITGGVFGIASAFAVSWSKLASTLHVGDLRSAGSVGRRYGRQFLAATEVALSLMLLIGAALLTRSFIALQRVEPGLNPSNVLTAGVLIPVAGRFEPLVDGPRWATTFNAISARVGASAGVVAAGAVSSLPLTGAFESGGVPLPGKTYQPGQTPTAQYSVVAGEYFKAAGIPVLAGRAFDGSDDQPGRASIIINRDAARRFFGSESDALGREIRSTFDFSDNGTVRTVVGIVGDVKQLSLDETPTPQAYVPVSQMAYPGLNLVVRTTGDPLAMLGAVKREISAVNPMVTLKDARTMDGVVSQSLSRQRFSMTLIGVFAALAVVLAIVGLYGVIALIVGQRRREIGVRLALGAAPGDVVRMILGEGARVAALGVALGVGGAFALTRVLQTLLYGVSATDTATFAGAALLVTGVAFIATYAPARRAAKVDPKTALTSE